MTVALWKDTAVDIQSALASAITIDGISNANPGVLTHSGADPSVGDYVVLPDLEGMVKLRDRVARVATVVAGVSFVLEGIDTTLFGDFGSGTFQVITFGTSMTTFTDLSASGGERKYVDVEYIHDDLTRKLAVGKDAFQVSFTSILDFASASLLALNALSDSNTKTAAKITLENSNILVFYGQLTASLIPGGSARELVTTAVEIQSLGDITGYAS